LLDQCAKALRDIAQWSVAVKPSGAIFYITPPTTVHAHVRAHTGTFLRKSMEQKGL
jgi:hypothetical protein